MKLLLALLGCLGMATTTALAAPADTVILLHGLGRTSGSMSHLASALTRDGYRVVNLDYPSRSVPLETLAHDWLPQQLRALDLAAIAAHTAPPPASSASLTAAPNQPAPRVHFVTHSMGGILVRLWLRDNGAPANLGHVVMLAPPNAGSELTDRLNAFPPFRWFTGTNGRRLGTAATDLPRALGPWPTFSSPSSALTSTSAPALGIIAADRSLNPFFSALLPGPDDGKVTVASTRLAGMSDHLVLPYSHTWLAWHAETARQIRAFLVAGHFRPSA